MKNKLIGLLLLLIFAGCKKDAILTYLEPVSFTGQLEASTENVEITANNLNESLISFSWPSVTFKIEAPVSYRLQVALPVDTLGDVLWSKSASVELGNDVLLKSFSGNELNTIALNTLELEEGVAHQLVARVVATMDRPVYSNAVVFNVQPFRVTTLAVLYLPGDYQGWNPAAATVIREVRDRPRMYEGYVYIPTGGTYQFKMTPQPDWNPMAYGDATGTSGDIIEANYAGGNMSVPGGGYYYMTANLNTNKWTATPVTWSILGDASPGGWNTDTPLTYDVTNKVWTVTANMTANGSFKFRANNAWALDFAWDPATNQIRYANNPFLGYTPDLLNLTVPEDGNYTLTLNLQDAGNYTYTLVKN